MTEIERTLRASRNELSAYGVRHLWLFGSAVREEDPRDVDILIEFSKPPGLLVFMGLKEFLEQRLERPVDLLSRSACEPYFLRRIEADLVNVA